MVKPADIYAQYDLDDNLFFLSTKIVLFANEPQEITEVAISTQLFAKVRNKFGQVSIITPVRSHKGQMIECPASVAEQEIDLINYKIVEENEASFREFRDDKKNYFLRDLKEAVLEKRFGPSFEDFKEHCGHKDSAKNVKIITARGQSPETIHAGLVYLKACGLIEHVPLLKNIIPVSYSKLKPERFRAQSSSPQEAKLQVLASVLDEIEKRPHSVSSSFGFSDDDEKTFEHTRNFLIKEIARGRWTKTHINLYFTGSGIKKQRFILAKPQLIKVD